jgi:hypothetical protein
MDSSWIIVVTCTVFHGQMILQFQTENGHTVVEIYHCMPVFVFGVLIAAL